MNNHAIEDTCTPLPSPKSFASSDSHSLLLKIIGFAGFIFIFGSQATHANTNTDFWTCYSEDENHLKWEATSQYKREAINLSFHECKKKSERPRSCHTSENTCDLYHNGKSTTPMWRCIALDQMSKNWPSNLYRNRDDAAIAAKAYCQHNSAMPDSCYINLLTCKNVNE